jgi:hypothetical protein
VLDVWGHSWEFGSDRFKWTETERFFKFIAHRSNVHYTAHIDLVNYIHAFRSLGISMDQKVVFNPSSMKVFFRYNNVIRSVGPKETIQL